MIIIVMKGPFIFCEAGEAGGIWKGWGGGGG